MAGAKNEAEELGARLDKLQAEGDAALCAPSPSGGLAARNRELEEEVVQLRTEVRMFEIRIEVWWRRC